MYCLVLFLDIITLGCRLLRKKGVLLIFGMIGLVSCMSLQAEPQQPELSDFLVLPLPEIPPDFLMELSQDIPQDLPEEILTKQELPFEAELPGEPVSLPSRPLRISSYTSPEQVPLQSQSWVPPVMQGRIPGLEQPMTQAYIHQYSNPRGLGWLDAIMRRGSAYFAFIRKEIELRDLPQELIYLPVIESEYVANAVSKSGATGLWQFMKNSIGPYDMKINDWMDERMDFWKSTIGALSKLQENYRVLGDWPLALAAYNTGLGRLNRIIQQTGIRDYWLLSEKKHLSQETIHYVPKLLAISYIMSQHRRFGINPLWPEDPEWTRIRVERTVDLDLLAQEAGIDKVELKRANGELFYHVTPGDTNYYLKVRTTDAAMVTAVLEQEELILIKYYFHIITPGDTLSVLAKHYGISVDAILNANPGVKAQYLKIGSRLRIPAYKDVPPYQKQQTAPVPPLGEETHLVKPGETLWSIAKLYHITPEALASANSMELNGILREGKRLKLR